MLRRVFPVLLLLAGYLSAQPAAPSRLRQYLQAQEDVNGFSGAVLLIKNSEVLLRTAAGA